MPRKRLALCLTLGLLHVVSPALAGEEPHGRATTETTIGSINRTTWIPGSVVVSPDNRRVAYINHVGWKSHLIVNGEKGADYDGFVPGSITFSPDSQRLAYIAASRETGKGFVVVDGTEWEPHDGFADGSLVFSPDSSRLACVAFSGRKEVSMKDNVLFGQEKVTAVGEKYVVLIDNEEATQQYDGIWTLIFSPDGKRVACTAGVGDKLCVVVDGQEGTHYESIRNDTLIFSPDGRHLAYIARLDNKDVVVVNGEEQGRYLQVVEGSLSYSPDSTHLAYAAAVRQGTWCVILDGKQGRQYDGFGEWPLVFSPDSKHIAYVAVDSGELVVVANDEELARHDALLLGPTWSSDSARLAYAPREGNKAFFVIDGTAGKQYDALGRPVFSPDSARVGYIARDGDQYLVVVDGEEVSRHSRIGSPAPVFGPDAKHVAYPAHDRGKDFVVLDGVDGKRYDAVVTRGGGTVVFDSSTSFHYIAIEDYEFLLVDEQIE